MLKILYNFEHVGLVDPVFMKTMKIEEDYSPEIKLVPVDTPGMYDRLGHGEAFDLVVIHMGSRLEDSFSIVEKCKRMNDSLIYVAESAMFPETKDEILTYFDEYTGHLMEKDTLKDLLEKRSLIWKKE